MLDIMEASKFSGQGYVLGWTTNIVNSTNNVTGNNYHPTAPKSRSFSHTLVCCILSGTTKTTPASPHALRPMSHLRFYRAILSRKFIVRQSCSTQLCMLHTATLSHKQALTKLIGQFLFTRQSRSV